MAESRADEARPRRTRSLDEGVERLSRWTAARLTRRSFFHRAGQVAMMVAAGPTVATILSRQAEARVSELSKPTSVAVTVMMTNGMPSAAWASTTPT